MDLDKLSLPEGISISRITGPVPERKYFPCKPAPEPAPESKPFQPWAQPQPGQFMPSFSSSQFAGTTFTPESQYSSSMQPQFGMGNGGSGDNSNVIVVDTNQLTTREEEERMRKEEEKGKKKKKGKKAGVESVPGATVFGASNPYPGIMPAPGPAEPKKEWNPAMYGGYDPQAGVGGGGQVLIKSVNGRVIITPVPGTGNNPPLPNSGDARPPAPSKPSPPLPASAHLQNGKVPVSNGVKNCVEITQIPAVQVMILKFMLMPFLKVKEILEDFRLNTCFLHPCGRSFWAH